MYNNGFPTSYQYYQPYPRQNGVLWIHGLQQANDYPMGPNEAVTLWDADAPSVYLKKTDASGKPTLTIFDLVERKMPAQEAEYSAKDEFGKLHEELGTLTGDVKRLLAALEKTDKE